MNRAGHLAEAETMLKLVAQLTQDPDQRAAAAEMVWGATVHALSAADPQHETTLSQPNVSHDAPNQRRTFLQAASRVANPNLSHSTLVACLDDNQGKLHTYFYHVNLSNSDLTVSMRDGVAYVQRIIAVAQTTLQPPTV